MFTASQMSIADVLSTAFQAFADDLVANRDREHALVELALYARRTEGLEHLGEKLYGGYYEMNIMINNALQFGLSDEFTGATLKDFIERYVRLGLITSMDDTDEILNLAWTPIL